MNKKSKKTTLGAQRRVCRHGKIARLPHDVREELNQRLRDGESAKFLVRWLNALPEAKAALRREFAGTPITEQNVSEWKQRGYRDWVAKIEADELMADTVVEGMEPKGDGGSRASRRKRSRGKSENEEKESVTDRVAQWFFPHYVAAARGQLAAAGTPAERWSVLRTICADLSSLRRNDHHVERLRIWRQKLQLETKVTEAQEEELTERQVVAWVRDHPEIEERIFPEREGLTSAEKEAAVNEILGITNPVVKAPPWPEQAMQEP